MNAEKHIAIDFKIILNQLIDNQHSFAYYRLPNTNQNILVVGEAIKLSNANIDFDTQDSGFLFASYTGHTNYFIKGDHVIINEEVINDSFEEFISGLNSKIELQNLELDDKIVSGDKEIYTKKISKVVDNIKHSELSKVVISRRKTAGKLKGNDFKRAFDNLCLSYPTAFVSISYVSDINQIWIGASPEILVSEDKNGVFRTVALAGTQSSTDHNGNEIAPIDALWSHKEIEEQALVGRYIVNCLKKVRVREYDELGPKTVKAGNLLHLLSTYSIDSKAINFHNLSSVMLELLHPTSAVCGMPKYLAQEQINNIEDYPREFYSGFLGPVNINAVSSLYVNLRTLKIQNNEVYTYAGGGITEDSNPEKEWLETELKMQTILKAF